jgi:ABC-type transport system substrate-binding protein
MPTLSLYYLGFRLDHKPLDDARVRQALAQAIDVDRAVVFTTRGMATAAHGPIPPGGEAHDPALRRPSFQPDAARRLLRDAGFPAERRLSLAYNASWAPVAELAEAIKADLAKVGVTVDLVAAPGWPEVVRDVRAGKVDMFVYGWLTLAAVADLRLRPLFASTSPDNLTRYQSARVDALLEQAAGQSDPGQREALYRAAQRAIADDAPMVFLFNEIRVAAHSTRVSGLELNSQGYPVDRFARVELRGP